MYDEASLFYCNNHDIFHFLMDMKYIFALLNSYLSLMYLQTLYNGVKFTLYGIQLILNVLHLIYLASLI